MPSSPPPAWPKKEKHGGYETKYMWRQTTFRLVYLERDSKTSSSYCSSISDQSSYENKTLHPWADPIIDDSFLRI